MKTGCASLLVLALALAGCGTGPVHFAREGPQAADSPNLRTSAEVTRRWKRDTGAGYADSSALLLPMAADDRIFVAEPAGLIQALDSASGKPLWQVDLEEPLAAGIGGDNSILVVATGEGTVVALGRDNGAVLWRTAIGSEVLARPVVTEDKVLVRSGDGQVIGLNAQTGVVGWRVRRAVPSLSVRGLSTPAIVEGVLVVGFANGRLAGIDVHSGQELWNVLIARPRGSNEITRLTDIDADPYRVGKLLFVAAYQGRISTLSLGNQSVLWRSDISTLKPMGSRARVLLVTADDGTIIGIDQSSGATLWTQTALRGRGVTGPLGLEGAERAVVGDYQGFVYLLDTVAGKVTSRARAPGGAVLAVLASSGDTFLTLSENGTLASWIPAD